MGKNEEKRATKAAMSDFNSEMTEEEREAMVRRGMGIHGGGLVAGEDQLVAKKLSKEEKKAQTEARRAAMAEKKNQVAAMKAAQQASRDASMAAEGGEADDGDVDGGLPMPLPTAPSAGDEGEGEGVDYTDNYAPAPGGAASSSDGAEAAKPKPKSKGNAAKGGKKGGKADASAKKRGPEGPTMVEGVMAMSEDLPFFQRTGPAAAKRKTMSLDIRIGGIRMCAGKQELLDYAVLALNYGVKYGLVGRNGVGKTTLLRHLADGRITLPKFIKCVHVEQVPCPSARTCTCTHACVHTRMHGTHACSLRCGCVHVEQEIEGDERSALQTIVQADEEREWLLKVENVLVEGDDSLEALLGITLNEVYERLEDLDSDNAEARAAQLLTGLGFDVNMQNKPTSEYSGGWRMRIALAKALFLKPDLLLLDEPTNHLDVHALTWLEYFLSAWDRTVLIVSHDRGFLNKVGMRACVHACMRACVHACMRACVHAYMRMHMNAHAYARTRTPTASCTRAHTRTCTQGDDRHNVHPRQAAALLWRQLRYLPQGASRAPRDECCARQAERSACHASQVLHRTLRPRCQKLGEAGAVADEDAAEAAG